MSGYRKFSFADHAKEFDGHIRASIRGLDDLRTEVVNASRYHVQGGTTVVDIGCSQGTVLRAIRDANRATRPGVRYLGIDVNSSFDVHWRANPVDDVEFRAVDARRHEFENTSLVISLFTLQFIPADDRVPLLRRIYDGLIEGGALIIAEKVLAQSARFERMLTTNYYGHKLRSFDQRVTYGVVRRMINKWLKAGASDDEKHRGFSAEEILQKALDLRGMMDPWEEPRLLDALHAAGFLPGEVQPLWRQHGLFGAWMARRGAERHTSQETTVMPSGTIIPIWVGRAPAPRSKRSTNG
jgi:tRNA (cmo5U34)-methyltransferase